MDDNEGTLKVDTRLFSFSGVIGRRDYAINIIYLFIISLAVSIPFMLWITYNATEFTEIFDYPKMLNSMPILLKSWIILITTLILPLSISNITRRLNDICAKVNKPLIIGLSVFFVITAYSKYFLPTYIYVILSLISLIPGLILLFYPGQITSKLPYDVTKIFNWGAFVGTWIWGLFNKSYIPLWFILLFFTPASFYFQLICGLKGNEWAFGKYNSDDYVEFNRKQERQTTIWLILTLVIVPIFYIAIFFILLFGLVYGVNKHTSTTKIERSQSYIEKYMDTYVSLYFKSHEITETENKFYIDPLDWSYSSFTEKKKVFDLAATTAAFEKNKLYKNSNEHFSKSSELPRTKIYNSENNELLGEFNMNKEVFSNGTFKEVIKATLSAYKFYKPTQNY